MAHHRHHHMGSNQKPDKLALVMRLLVGLVGLTVGFIAGHFVAPPLSFAIKSGVVPPPAAGVALLPVGAPLRERVAAVPRMDEDALTGVLAAVQEEWSRAGSSIAGAPDTPLYLRIIFSRWTDLSGAGALRAALNLNDNSLSRLAAESVMTEWALRDPLAASQSLTLIPSSAAQQRAAFATVRSAVKRSPAEGLALARSLVAGTPPVLRGRAGAEWMRRDAGHALRYLSEDPGMAGAVASGAALAQWLVEDPAAWFSWWRVGGSGTKLPLLRFSPEMMTPGLATRLGAALTTEFRSLEQGLAWLREAAGNYMQPLSTTLAPVLSFDAAMRSWQVEHSTLAPAGTVSGWLARMRQIRTIAGLLPRIAATEPATALKLLSSMPSADEMACFAPAIAAQWLEQAPASASAGIFAADLTNPAARAAAAAAVDALISSDPLRALDKLTSLPLDEAERQKHRVAALQQLCHTNPAGMLEWLGTHPENKAPDSLISTAVNQLAATNSARAAEWVLKHAPPHLRASLTGVVFDVQLRSDRDGAIASLAAVSAVAERDAMLMTLTNADIALSRRDRFFAGNLLPDTFIRALGITAEAARLDALGRIITAMKETGVSAAASLAHPSLLPAERAALSR